ncbi:MAG TPA: CmpA/NrtA family ABC transporter substrate-binding protein [Rhodocyclaceae bacterium]|nr:ABC transporter substrate-binding protein [Rhodocyclaceae bacterium]HMV54040.1 CmpA/NrtA family ABC transporter substrate-binding protein [Rhodocyclaceae bacterium]HMZ82864.1 CmpA/NrtA family ABC transporter substrate-binding protein [Rhodocyclaceae bacterium]HNA02772.1 CmpA/NrtA family ABC transporter substrate-binding protein [Rhodocyclaceae bacterium]HNB78328.1 CmpA/NrtA family ABC transporter substrate-binding protein [Rhodocyclaceae bacterium]
MDDKLFDARTLLRDPSRRGFLRQGAALGAGAALMSALPGSGAFAAGSDAPEKKEVRIGFIPLTDCASVVMAAVNKFDEKYGIKIIPSKEASWAAVRDKLVNGELDAAHVLYGLVYGVHLGIGGPKKDMAVLMSINNNGQAITLSNKLKEQGVTDGAGLKKLIVSKPGEYTFAQTFPTGTHAMWLYYWLAANDINPMKDVKVITVPPPQMVANMRVGNMDGFCVGEPWNNRAIIDNIGFTAVTTQDIWVDHPEKVLGTTAEFVQKNPNTARAMTAAVLEAGRWIDASLGNRQKTAETIAQKSYVNTDMDVILARMLGRYQNGLGKSWDDKNAMKFFNDGAVNFPYLSDGMWFLTQHRRWGLLKSDPDYLAVARAVNRTDIYRQAATAVGIGLPKSDMRTSKLIDGVVWDGRDPKKYAGSFKVNTA